MRGDYLIKSVVDVLKSLDALCREGGEIRVSEFSRKLGVNKSKSSRLLATFEYSGIVEKEKRSGGYVFTPKAYKSSIEVLKNVDLIRTFRPLMVSMSNYLGHGVYLCIPVGNDIFFLDFFESNNSVDSFFWGKTYRVGSASAGKVIEAYLYDMDYLLPEYRQIREIGYCVDYDVLCRGISSVSVPLFDINEKVIASFCIVVKTSELEDISYMKKIIRRIKKNSNLLRE